MKLLKIVLSMLALNRSHIEAAKMADGGGPHNTPSNDWLGIFSTGFSTIAGMAKSISVGNTFIAATAYTVTSLVNTYFYYDHEDNKLEHEAGESSKRYKHESEESSKRYERILIDRCYEICSYMFLSYIFLT